MREIVCFDIETRTEQEHRNLIIRDRRAVLRTGKVEETFKPSQAPGGCLPGDRGAYGHHRQDAGGLRQEEAVNGLFGTYVGFTGPLAAHKAEFDMGLLTQACRRMGKALSPHAIDNL